jgi:alpha-glucosidase (family GH31 glycosyl hydrolase)
MRVFEGGSTKTFTDINLATVPVFQRGGHIVPYKFRLRRSTTQMNDDPFTLVVTLDKNVVIYTFFRYLVTCGSSKNSITTEQRFFYIEFVAFVTF